MIAVIGPPKVFQATPYRRDSRYLRIAEIYEFRTAIF